MSVYAVCSACRSSTRLTERLALDIARKPGPPSSICCNADMSLTYTAPTTSDLSHPQPLTTEAWTEAALAIQRRDRHDHGLKPPPAANP